MLVECIANSTSLLNNWSKSATPIEELLEIGKVYNVYGLYLGEIVAYEILLNKLDNHTNEFPSYLFKVVDNRLSSFFVIGKSERFWKNGQVKIAPFISFPEWANDINFFDRLIEGGTEEQRVFNKYKELLYLEYRSVGVSAEAIIIQENWVQCPVCTEAWELENTNFEMCQCPQCRTVLLNPYRW